MSRSLLRHRILAIIAAFAMVTVICGFMAQGFAAHGHQPDHCDWSMHFTGVAGSAPKPAPIARPAPLGGQGISALGWMRLVRCSVLRSVWCISRSVAASFSTRSEV